MVTGNRCVAVDCAMLEEISAYEMEKITTELTLSDSDDADHLTEEETCIDIDNAMLDKISLSEEEVVVIAEAETISATPPKTPTIARTARTNRAIANAEYRITYRNSITLSYLRCRSILLFFTALSISLIIVSMYPFCLNKKESKIKSCDIIVIGLSFLMLPIFCTLQVFLYSSERHEISRFVEVNQPANR
ncbi:hypothetical protein [Candidatus Ichthyocystis hellenicum]|uniref:hypothetical protein n=1 Tax=Candidatus Ichthyocystis hellenicum TaxID=1561003 RepID=UPI000B89FA3D|nr:hypothetical protein [Candidatus Ichthyocystis hellenicum]